MVNAGLKSCLAVLVLATAVLTAAAALRGAEYDEQYTLFLTAGVPRPVWPDTPFTAGDVQRLQAGHAGLAAITRDLRTTDVHPPLYFWAVALWRRLAGSGLLAARLFSVLCSVAALAAVGVIARCAGVPPALAMLLALGCYGFAYTGVIARGFALAQALTLWGIAVLLRADGRRWRMFGGGALLGAATFANYLAVFVALAVLAARAGVKGAGPARFSSPCAASAARPRPTRGGGMPCALPAFLAFGCADVWCFLPQRNARAGQFPAFHWLDALSQLARYGAANLFGGLPLYAAAPMQRGVALGLVLLAAGCCVLVVLRWRRIGQCAAARWLFATAAAAPPAGLLLLGLVFRNTPIELRYLAFATPFIALLLAGMLASLPRLPRRAAIGMLLAVQAAALAGMMTRSETMQPARAAAIAAARLAPGGLVLLPRGNDGVGIVGAFGIEAPAAQRLLVVDFDEPPARVRARIGSARRVVLALVAQDDASRATLPALRAVVSGPCWREIGAGFETAAFERSRQCGAPSFAAATTAVPGGRIAPLPALRPRVRRGWQQRKVLRRSAGDDADAGG